MYDPGFDELVMLRPADMFRECPHRLRLASPKILIPHVLPLLALTGNISLLLISIFLFPQAAQISC